MPAGHDDGSPAKMYADQYRKDAEKNKTPKIFITLEGGLIQDIKSTLPVDIVIADLDTDGADPNKITALFDYDGNPMHCLVRAEEVRSSYIEGEYVELMFREFNGKSWS